MREVQARRIILNQESGCGAAATEEIDVGEEMCKAKEEAEAENREVRV